MALILKPRASAALLGLLTVATAVSTAVTTERKKEKEKARLAPAEPARREQLKKDREQAVKDAETRPFGLEAALNDLKQFKVAKGLEATLFACEPMLVNPANMDIDHRGRIWLTEGANYRITERMKKPWGLQREGGDRVVILEDTDGDGRADKATVFYQGMDVNAALGICVLGNKVIVTSSPKVFVLTDTNGDDQADNKEVLFTDDSQGDHDHCLHAFVFGPDGRLYFNCGNEVKQLRDKNGQPVVDLAGNEVTANGKPYREGMTFRCNPDGSAVETLGWNFRNPYEVAIDSFGTLWQPDNDDDGNKGVRINYVMEFGNYGYKDEKTGDAWKTPRTGWEDEIPKRHWHQNDPGVVPNLLQTGAGSPTGLLVYEGNLLPKVFHGQMIHCDAGPRAVRAYPVKPDGAGYKAGIVDILTTEETWFRPADVCTAPDGSIYVADWNDAGVGGHNMADRKLERMSGRIYRVAPKGHPAAAGPKFDFAAAKGCVQALQSPNLAARYLAWTALHRMQGAAEPELLQLWKSSDPRMRARALHLLARIKGSGKQYIETALKDKNPDLRITGLRIARERKLDPIPFVEALVNDRSAQVRRECAIALRGDKSPAAARLWAQLAAQHDGRDRWYLEALGIGAAGQEERFFAAWRARVGDQWNTPGGRDIVWRLRTKESPALLAQLILDPKTAPDARLRFFRAFDFLEGPEKDAALVSLIKSVNSSGGN
jgi:putative membrane-bound dehydrogenase-like protein